MRSPQCPVCSHPAEFKVLPSTDDKLTMSKCVKCRSAWLNPVPSRAEIMTYYPPEYYGGETSKFVAPIERLLARLSARFVTKASKTLDPGSRLLDIGCGRGLFLRELAKRGFDTHGTELSLIADKSISDLCTIHVTDSLTSLQFQDNYFDMVILWHVLEHLPDPQETLSEISRILSPGGRLALAVPNYGSLQARLFGHRWFHLDLPRHIFHLTLTGLTRLLETSDLEIKSVNHFSFIQNGFGWIQSILNRLPGLEINFLYNLLHKQTANSQIRLLRPTALTHIICAALVFPLALILTLIEGIAHNGGTIEIIAKKPPIQRRNRASDI